MKKAVANNLGRVALAVKNTTEAAFKDKEVTSVQYDILKLLTDGETDAKFLVENTTGAADISRLLERLEKKELLERRINPLNRRSIIISITSRGEFIVRKYAKEREKGLKVLDTLTNAQIKVLNKLLNLI